MDNLNNTSKIVLLGATAGILGIGAIVGYSVINQDSNLPEQPETVEFLDNQNLDNTEDNIASENEMNNVNNGVEEVIANTSFFYLETFESREYGNGQGTAPVVTNRNIFQQSLNEQEPKLVGEGYGISIDPSKNLLAYIHINYEDKQHELVIYNISEGTEQRIVISDLSDLDEDIWPTYASLPERWLANSKYVLLDRGSSNIRSRTIVDVENAEVVTRFTYTPSANEVFVDNKFYYNSVVKEEDVDFSYNVRPYETGQANGVWVYDFELDNHSLIIPPTVNQDSSLLKIENNYLYYSLRKIEDDFTDGVSREFYRYNLETGDNVMVDESAVSENLPNENVDETTLRENILDIIIDNNIEYEREYAGTISSITSHGQLDGWYIFRLRTGLDDYQAYLVNINDPESLVSLEDLGNILSIVW